MPVTPELSQYITQARATGMSDDVIRTELLKAGWQVADVNEAIPARIPSFAPVVAPTEPVPAKPKRSHLGFIVTVALLLVIGGATYFFLPNIVGVYMKFTERPIVVDDVVIPTAPLSNIASTTISSTDGWFLYRNEALGFEIKYPSLLVFDESSGKTTLSHSVVYPHPDPCDFKGDRKPLDKFTDFNLSFEVKGASIKEITSQFSSYLKPYLVGSTTFQNYSMGVEGCGQDTYYLSLATDKTLVVTHSYVAEYSPVNGDHETFLKLPGVLSPEKISQTFQQILSTFKFISLATSTSSSSEGYSLLENSKLWEEYKNEGLKFSLLYPRGSNAFVVHELDKRFPFVVGVKNTTSKPFLIVGVGYNFNIVENKYTSIQDWISLNLEMHKKNTKINSISFHEIIIDGQNVTEEGYFDTGDTGGKFHKVLYFKEIPVVLDYSWGKDVQENLSKDIDSILDVTHIDLEHIKEVQNL